MLDKGQIKDWDGKPEDDPAKGAAKPVVATPEAVAAPTKSLATTLFEAREAIPTGERVTLTPEQVLARKRRGQWIALALVAFVIIVFVLTMSKVGGGIAERM